MQSHKLLMRWKVSVASTLQGKKKGKAAEAEGRKGDKEMAWEEGVEMFYSNTEGFYLFENYKFNVKNVLSRYT